MELGVRTLAISCLFSCALSIFAVQTARASKQHTRLDYRRAPAASGCATETDLKVAIGARLGYNPFRENAKLQFEIRVRKKAMEAGYRAQISITSRDKSQRKIQQLETARGPCDRLIDAVVVAVSVAIDPSVGLSKTALSRRTGQALTALEMSRLQVSFANAAARSTVFRKLFSKTGGSEDSEATNLATGLSSLGPDTIVLAGGVGISGGTSPGPAFFPAIGVALGYGGFSVRLDARFDFTKQKRTNRGAFESSLFATELAGCGVPGNWFICGVLAGGALRQRGVALETNKDSVTPYWGTGARLGGNLNLSRNLGLRFRGELLASLVEVETRVSSETVWRTPPVSGHIGTFLFFRFE